MARQLRKPGIGERLGQLGYLLKHTFTIVGRDPGIVRPFLRMAIYGMVLTTVFFGAIFAYAVGSNGLGSLLLLATLGLFFYKFFYYVRQELRQSWLVSESLQGRSRDASQAGDRVRELRSTYRRIALIDMLVAWIASRAQKGEGNMLVRLFISGLVEVWDLINHYMLPSAAVDSYGIRDGVERMKQLKENVPETLAGVFGIDIAARAVGVIVGPIYMVLVLIAIGIGLWIGESLPAFYAGNATQLLAGIDPELAPDRALHFSWLPLLIAIWVGKLFSVVLERMATSVKVIYFSIFYMRITHVQDIIPEIRDELDGFLRMESEPDGPLVGETS